MSPEQWEEIRRAYKVWMPYIMQASEEGHRVDPYFFDWVTVFTPIEYDVWSSIRSRGIPLYPQVPALNYFIDFANPYIKIGIEADGKHWHDIVKDRNRDEQLINAGWKIFRVTGSEAWATKTPPDEDTPEYDDIVDDWLMNTADGVVQAIHEVYFLNNPDGLNGGYLRTLTAHQLVPFKVWP